MEGKRRKNDEGRRGRRGARGEKGTSSARALRCMVEKYGWKRKIFIIAPGGAGLSICPVL